MIGPSASGGSVPARWRGATGSRAAGWPSHRASSGRRRLARLGSLWHWWAVIFTPTPLPEKSYKLPAVLFSYTICSTNCLGHDMGMHVAAQLGSSRSARKHQHAGRRALSLWGTDLSLSLYIYIYRDMNMYVCMHICIYIYIYTHTYTHMYTHTCTHIWHQFSLWCEWQTVPRVPPGSFVAHVIPSSLMSRRSTRDHDIA